MRATSHTFRASFGALLCLIASHAAGAESDLQVKVETAGDEIRSVASLFVRASQQRVWEVITDFERAPRFMRNLQVSKVLSQAGDAVRVLQKNEFRFGPFTIPVETVRDIRLTEPQKMESRLVSGSVQKYDSRTELTPESGGTRITYRSQIVPGAVLAIFANESAIRRETEEFFKQVRDEILRREHLAASH